MRYVISVIDSTTGSASPAETAMIDEFNDTVRTAGELILAVGLADPSTATVIDGRDGSRDVIEGALHTGDEYVSGMWMIDVADHAVALDRAAAASRACNRRVELRAVLGG
ncbi:MAG: hypothetical protein RIR49_1958 [Actinomycetota bacterium]|jgi:hypothetical protein